VKRTESLEKVSTEDVSKESASSRPKKRLKASNLIIAVLFVAVCILLYPKIFQKDKFERMRDPDGKITIAVMPFENLTGDTLFNVWQSGFQNLLIATLSNSKELSVLQYHTMYAILESKKNLSYSSITPSVAGELASKLDTKTYILGDILMAGNEIRINAQLINAETEEIYKTYHVKGISEESIFAMVDSLSGLIKNYLEIKKLAEDFDNPGINESIGTNSSEAFEYFIHGWDAFMGLDFQSATGWLSKAIDADSGFIMAYGTLSFAYNIWGNDEQSKTWCNKVYKKRDELPLKQKLLVEHLHAYYYKTPPEEINYIKQILEIDELNTTYWYLLGLIYYHQQVDYQEAVISFEKALEIHKKWGTTYRNPWIYACLGDSYHQLNNHKREREVYELGLDIFPENTRIVQRQAICALSEGDLEKADDFILKYSSIHRNRDKLPESRILAGVGFVFEDANLLVEAEENYRKALELDPRSPLRINNLAWFLIEHDINVNEGVELIDGALEQMPDNPYYLDTKGWGLYKQGKIREAMELLTLAWDKRHRYNVDIDLHIQEVQQTLANQTN